MGATALTMSMMIVSPLHAQAAPAKPAPAASKPPATTAPVPATPPAPEPDDIVVTSFRASLEAGLDIKRQAIAVVDSIVAEDIGKFPTQNIAEALQRIPGIEMVRNSESNEGNRIQLRGLGAEFTLTTLNGAQIKTTSSTNIGGSTRDFNYDVFPSELFARADVIKTPLAELEEGGVAGVVNLRLPKPFDRPGLKISGGVSGQYNTLSKYWNPRGNLLVSGNFGDFGILIGVAKSGNRNRRGGFESTGMYYSEAANVRFNPNSAFNDLRGGASVTPPPGGTNGLDTFRLDYTNPAANLNGVSRADLSEALVPRLFRSVATQNERERWGGNASLQWKTDRVDVSLDMLYSKLDDEFQRHILGFPTRGSIRIAQGPAFNPNFLVSNGAISSTNIPAWVPLKPSVDANGKLQGSFGNVTLQNADVYTKSRTEFFNITLNGRFKLTEDLTLVAQAGQSRSKAERSDNTAIINGLDALHTITFDSATDPFFPTLSTNRSLLDATSYRELLLTGFRTQEKDLQRNARLVVEYDWGWGAFDGKLKIGGAYTESTKELQRSSFGNGANDPANPLSQFVVPGVGRFGALTPAQKAAYFQTILTPLNLSGFSNQGSANAPTSWLFVSRDYLENTLNIDSANASAPFDASTSFKTVERIKALFVQTDFRTELFGNTLRGNVGLRYVDTTTDINNFALRAGVATPVNIRGGYKNWLPSASAVYNVTDTILARVLYGRTLTRSSLRLISSPVSIPNPGIASITIGNPDLAPQYASNWDFIGEWYFDRGGVLSAGYFTKVITNRPVQQTETNIPFSTLGIPDSLFSSPINTGNGVNPNEPFTVNRPVNLDRYTVKGFEFAYQQQLRFLPQPFDGLGLIGSLTLISTADLPWTATDGTKQRLRILPKYTLSGTVYYEKGPLSLRASYTYRAEQFEGGNVTSFLTQNNGIDTQIWSNGRGYLDASAGYKVTKNIEFRIDAQNLTNTRTFQFARQKDGKYGDEKSRVDNAFKNGINLTFGVRANF